MDRRNFLRFGLAAAATAVGVVPPSEPLPELSQWALAKAKPTGEHWWKMHYVHKGCKEPLVVNAWAEYEDLLTHSREDHKGCCQSMYEKYGFQKAEGYRVYLQDGDQYYLVTPYHYDLIPVKEIT